MSLSTMTQFFQPHALGHTHEEAEVTVFFGDRLSVRSDACAAFPDYKLIFLHQTHSDRVVASPYEGAEPEADAHFTRDRRVALCVRTADCMPVMIHEPVSGWIASIHAGWRGIENEIIRKTCARLTSLGASLDRARAWIGPHIGAASFEVGDDVAARLEGVFDKVRGFSSATTAVIAGDKTRVDLLAIARAQLAAHGIERERLFMLEIDTVQSAAHESFRRDRERAGRQISFIALK